MSGLTDRQTELTAVHVLTLPDGSTHVATSEQSARLLLQRAQGAVQKWPEGFSGFRAAVHCRIGSTEATGSVAVRAAGIEVRVPEAEAQAVLESMLAEVAEQRTPRFFKDGDGAFPITSIGGDTRGPIVYVHRPMGIVAYWLDRRGRLLQIEEPRHRLRVLTRIEEWGRATPGRVLPTRTTTSIFDRVSGSLIRTEAVVDAHCRLDHVWLPASRRLTVSGVAVTRAVAIEFHDHVLL